jgi:hypothetical protein
MRHRLDPSIEIRIRTSSEEVVEKEFRDWSRPARVQTRYRKHKGTPSTARGGAFYGRPAPMSKGLTASTNHHQLEDGMGISMKTSPSFLENEKTVCIFEETLAPPFQNRRNRELTNPTKEARQCQALRLPNRRKKTSRHSSQTSRRRKLSRRMILGFKKDLARKRMTRPWQAQLAKLPRVVAVSNRTPRRKEGYKSVYSFDWDG